MPDFEQSLVTENTVWAVLEGGPSGLPEGLRQRREPTDEARIKVPYGAGYEHFERTPEPVTPVVYRWVARTRIAE